MHYAEEEMENIKDKLGDTQIEWKLPNISRSYRKRQSRFEENQYW